jgi:hypothetical protein
MLNQLFKLRDCGVLRVNTISHWNRPLDDALTQLGLLRTQAHLTEIPWTLAKQIITKILWKDLAYNVELMPKKTASHYTEQLMVMLYSEDCKLYTNGEWAKDGEDITLSIWNQLTDATFDSGVLFVSPHACSCVWVEDED